MATILTDVLRAALTRTPCVEQWSKVLAEWPDTIPINEETLARARELGLDLFWLGIALPQPYRAEYVRQRDALLAEYERQRAPLWAEYVRQRDALLAEYERQHAPLWAEYERQHAPLLAEYERQRDAVLLARLIAMAEVA